jgi:aminopeptidase
LSRLYAELAVRVGVDVGHGQHVFVQTDVEHASFARDVVDAAYRTGASLVDVYYTDQLVRRSFLEAADEEMLTYSPPWLVQRVESMRELHGAEILVTGHPSPGAFAGIDEKRIGRARPLEYVKRLMAARGKAVAWTIVAAPSTGWAEHVFGTSDLEPLWRAIERVVRLDEPDPVASWREHLAHLRQRAEVLNQHHFDALHFQGPETDLTIGLLDVSRWICGGAKTDDGRSYCANLPTEEVFTTPDPSRTEGFVRATRPFLPKPDVVIDDVSLRFEEGRIVELHASSGEDILRSELESDARAPFLGEVALVSGDSRVGELKTTFFNTLLDENATCHIAYGFSIPRATNFQPGGNTASVHADLMIGGPEVSVEGLDRNGNATPILREDVWLLGS